MTDPVVPTVGDGELLRAAVAVCDLFGDDWPSLEPKTAEEGERPRLPMDRGDAAKVNALRVALGWERRPDGSWLRPVAAES